MLYIATRKRARLDSTKSVFLFSQEGLVCSIILRNNNTLLALNGISVTTTESTAIVQRENIYHSRCHFFQSLVIPILFFNTKVLKINYVISWLHRSVPVCNELSSRPKGSHENKKSNLIT